MIDIDEYSKIIEKENEKIDLAKREMSKVIVGQKNLVDKLFIALLTGGHVLLEGLPGLAKTLTIKTLAQIAKADFKRVQFTPDLLPADLIGTSIYNPKEGNFLIKKGPIFTNILLADEINRAPAKVQSALLEVMQERQVTISGQTFQLDAPYMVLATQNPIEQEGTYPLPEAQTDRFMMKLEISYPSMDEEKEILEKISTLREMPQVNSVLEMDDIMRIRSIVDKIYVDEKILQYILNIIFATRSGKEFNLDISHLILFGASPRASIILKAAAMGHAFLSRRAYVTPHDVKKVCFDVLRHRIKLSYEAEAENITADQIIEKIINEIAVP